MKASMHLKIKWFGRRSEASPNIIKATAHDLIDRFGERSTCVANHQALKARRREDNYGVSAWRWTAYSTADILRCEPDEVSQT
jgi:hypothetical protein